MKSLAKGILPPVIFVAVSFLVFVLLAQRHMEAKYGKLSDACAAYLRGEAARCETQSVPPIEEMDWPDRVIAVSLITDIRVLHVAAGLGSLRDLKKEMEDPARREQAKQVFISNPTNIGYYAKIQQGCLASESAQIVQACDELLKTKVPSNLHLVLLSVSANLRAIAEDYDELMRLKAELIPEL